MPVFKGTVTKLLRRRADKVVFGFYVGDTEYMIAPDFKRGEEYEIPEFENLLVAGTYELWTNQKGEEKKQALTIKILGTDVTTPDAPEPDGEWPPDAPEQARTGPTEREIHIMRQAFLKAASALLAVSAGGAQEKGEAAVAVAKRYEQYTLTGE